MPVLKNKSKFLIKLSGTNPQLEPSLPILIVSRMELELIILIFFFSKACVQGLSETGWVRMEKN